MQPLFEVLAVRTLCESGGTRFSPQQSPRQVLGAGGTNHPTLALEPRGLLGAVVGSALRPWGMNRGALPPPALSSPSSSDEELDRSGGGSEASTAEPCEERPPRPEAAPLTQPLTRHSSLREAQTRTFSAQSPEEPRALHGEQRALPHRRSR